MPKTWEECGREDLYMIPRMLKAGFAAEFRYNDKVCGRVTPQHVPLDAVTFINTKTTTAWAVRDCWMVAELDNGSYVNHRPFKSLEEFLIREGYEK